MSKRTCDVDSCGRTVQSGQKYCSGHAARLHRLGDVQADKPLRKRKPSSPKPRNGRPDCSVDGCVKPARSKSAEFCGMHYHRLYRETDLGDATQRKRSQRNPECAVDECDKPDRAGGYCSMHATRIYRHGDYNIVIASEDRALPLGEDHHNWRGDDIGYGAAHSRVKRLNGLASSHLCVGCGYPADHWSYDHADPDEKIEELAGGSVAYSTDVDHYQPRCVPCHKRYDLDRINSTKFISGAMALL